MYKYLLLFFLLPVFTFAYEAVMVEFVSYEDTRQIALKEHSVAYYGELNDFPHTYELTVPEVTEVKIGIYEPDMEGSQSNHSGIIVKRNKGRVEEVARLHYREADWEIYREKLSGDSYLKGGEFSGQLEPGSYLIEVSTGGNEGKYVLVAGEFSGTEGFTMKSVREIKAFFGKSFLSWFVSPFYYVPTIVLLMLLAAYFLRKKYAN